MTSAIRAEPEPVEIRDHRPRSEAWRSSFRDDLGVSLEGEGTPFTMSTA